VSPLLAHAGGEARSSTAGGFVRSPAKLVPLPLVRSERDTGPMMDGTNLKGERLPILGWREWLGLHDPDLPRIKVKVDTGARSSALHATDIEELPSDEVLFTVHPHQRRLGDEVRIRAPILDRRRVRSSSGQAQLRPVVELEVQLGSHRWPVEVTLTRRDLMGFRMLLGRTAIRGRFLVDPARSFVQGDPLRERSGESPDPRPSPTDSAATDSRE